MAKKMKEFGTYDLDLKTILNTYDIDSNKLNSAINDHGLRCKYVGGHLYMQSEQLNKYFSKVSPINIIEEPVVEDVQEVVDEIEQPEVLVPFCQEEGTVILDTVTTTNAVDVEYKEATND